MKNKLAVLALLVVVLSGCVGSNGGGIVAGFGGPGASWELINPKIVIAGPTTTLSADRYTHIGTNGFPITGSTNVTMAVPATATLMVSPTK